MFLPLCVFPSLYFSYGSCEPLDGQMSQTVAEFILETSYPSETNHPSQTDNSSKYKFGTKTNYGAKFVSG